jgi:hypothetical protein
MHNITELPPWERLLKKMTWAQLGDIRGKRILDFGSGQGITANHYAQHNDVVAIEPSKEMLQNRWADYPYMQITGSLSPLIGVEDQARRRRARCQSHGQRIFREAGPGVPTDGPADDSSGKQVHHHRQIKPLLADLQLSDDARPSLVGFGRLEVPAEQIGRYRRGFGQSAIVLVTASTLG